MTTLTISHSRFPEANGSHGSPYAKNRLVQEWRTLTMIEARRLRLAPVPSPWRLDVQVHRTSLRHSDATNAFWAIKAAVDALVKEGVLAGDCDCHCAATTIRRGPQSERPAITLTFEAVSS